MRAEEFTQIAAAERFGISVDKYRRRRKKADDQFNRILQKETNLNLEELKAGKQWAFNPLDAHQMKRYDHDNAIGRDRFTEAQTGILAPGVAERIEAGLGNERLPTNGADFSDNVRRRAASTFQAISRAVSEIRSHTGRGELEASLVLTNILRSPKDVTALNEEGEPLPPRAQKLVNDLRAQIPRVRDGKLEELYPRLAQGVEPRRTQFNLRGSAPRREI